MADEMGGRGWMMTMLIKDSAGMEAKRTRARDAGLGFSSARMRYNYDLEVRDHLYYIERKVNCIGRVMSVQEVIDKHLIGLHRCASLDRMLRATRISFVIPFLSSALAAFAPLYTAQFYQITSVGSQLAIESLFQQGICIPGVHECLA